VTSIASPRQGERIRECDGQRVPALYDAVVMHSRQTPVANRFRYKVSYWLVDYDDLPRRRGVLGRLVRFERDDHVDVRALLRGRGVGADRVLMMAMAQSFGHVFNPISVFWCYDAHDRVIAVLADVHNTYGDSHTYFLEPGATDSFTVEKMMYVSPFYPVDGSYDIRVSEPNSSVSVSVTLRRENDSPFVATLHGTRRNACFASLVRHSLRRPALRVAFLIRWQAFRLWRQGLRPEPR
jgi:uncharacterized protein